LIFKTVTSAQARIRGRVIGVITPQNSIFSISQRATFDKQTVKIQQSITQNYNNTNLTLPCVIQSICESPKRRQPSVSVKKTAEYIFHSATALKTYFIIGTEFSSGSL